MDEYGYRSDDRDEALLGAINAEESNAYGTDGNSDLSNERAQNIDRFLGKNVTPAPDGRSQVRDRSVYETVSFIKPSLARIFANGDDVIELPPIGPDDEEGAKQEAQYLNYVILQRNNWFDIFDTAATDLLLSKASYLYIYPEKRRQIEIETYKNQTPESLTLLMQDSPKILSLKEKPDTDTPPQPMVDPQTGQPMMGPDGQPMMQPPAMLYDVQIRRTKVETAFCIRPLAPERCKIAESCEDVQLTDAAYFEYYDYPTISDLRQMGYEIDDDIASDSKDTQEEVARNQYAEIALDRTDTNDPTMRRVKCRWIWIRYDYDEDGLAELQYCIVVGNKVLYREEVNRIPVAVLCPDKLPHRHIGLCPADTVADIEEIKTAILRQGLDNLYLTNNARTFVVPGMVNLDDVLTSRPGGAIRGKQGAVFGQHIAPMPVEFMFPQAMQGLEYMDQIKENRAGVNRYFTGIDQNAMNKTASGMQMLSTMSAQRVEQIARNIANGVEVMGSLLHEIILKSGHKAETVKLRGQWVEVDPSTWRKRTDFKISVGFAAGNKDQLMQRLMVIANLQSQALQGGLPIVNARNAYETAMEITKAADMQAPTRFWQDPKDAPSPPPPQPDPNLMASEQMKTQRDLAVKKLDVQQKELDSQRDFAIKKYEIETGAHVDITKHRAQLIHDAQIGQLGTESDMQMEHLKSQLNPKMVEAQAKAHEGASAIEAIKALQDAHHQHSQHIMAALHSMTQALAAPREFVRDPKTGKPVGSRIATE